MKNSKKVYFIILNFNAYEDTINCVKSIRKNCGYNNYEIVIVDNNSKDNSYNLLKEEFNDCILLKSKENKGYANGNNIGIKYALKNRADYICVLNNDVEVEQDFLKIILEKFNENSSIGMVGPCICDYKNKNKIQSMGANINLFTGLAQAKLKNAVYNKYKDSEFDVDYLGGACFVVKRDVFEKIGLIPENYFLFFEETEFCLKAKKKGYKLICLGKSKVYHKGSATISKYGGLSYFFLNRNRVVFIRRNAKLFHKIIFYPYVFIEAIGRMIIRKEPKKLIEYYIEGIKAETDKMDVESINKFLG